MQAQTYANTGAERRTLSVPLRNAREDVTLIGITKAFGRDREIFAEGGDADFVYKLISGAVRCFRLLADGRRQITDFFLPGDIFGVEFGEVRRTGAEALCDSVVVVARRSAVLSDPEQSGRLWRRSAAELQRSQEHVLTLGRRSAVERVASFLVDLADRTGAADTLELPMSRQDMADYLGLTIETVSRTLTQLQAQRLIKLQTCRSVQFRDREALEDLAL
jgi:CRP/FNR family nitrogen fixation transcriptional regulator